MLTREVARRRELVHHYFANTFVLKFLLGVLGLAVALAGGWVIGMDTETLLVIALLGPAVVLEQLMATVFAVFMSLERIELMASANSPTLKVSEVLVHAARTPER